ncbi:hypothetical protein CCACVL1_16239 [Corchorus capsularis]|uniref:Uncharacterized protein n=1 Tax=Corchorus capsularis TaxID=210143 RepID=A0A1R3HYB4_COCAP|nr:hypothetical protein CCACVL1_16239 [Corchorus capsularis]
MEPIISVADDQSSSSSSFEEKGDRFG